MEKRWCSFHKRMESVNEFQENSFNADGKQNVCAKGQNYYMSNYYSLHKEAMHKKSCVYSLLRRGVISEEQKNSQIRSINKKYGISSRI